MKLVSSPHLKVLGTWNPASEWPLKYLHEILTELRPQLSWQTEAWENGCLKGYYRIPLCGWKRIIQVLSSKVKYSWEKTSSIKECNCQFPYCSGNMPTGKVQQGPNSILQWIAVYKCILNLSITQGSCNPRRWNSRMPSDSETTTVPLPDLGSCQAGFHKQHLC